MSEPREADRTQAGMLRWGSSMAESAFVTEPQMRAFETLMREAPKTTTGDAYPGKSTRIADHCVWLNANAVGTLEKVGLVDVVLRGAGDSIYRVAKPTNRGRAAWGKLHPEVDIFDDDDITRDHSAWAPIRKAIRFLDRLGVDNEIPVEVATRCEDLADELRECLPILGGGHALPRTTRDVRGRAFKDDGSADR